MFSFSYIIFFTYFYMKKHKNGLWALQYIRPFYRPSVRMLILLNHWTNLNHMWSGYRDKNTSSFNLIPKFSTPLVTSIIDSTSAHRVRFLHSFFYFLYSKLCGIADKSAWLAPTPRCTPSFILKELCMDVSAASRVYNERLSWCFIS